MKLIHFLSQKFKKRGIVFSLLAIGAVLSNAGCFQPAQEKTVAVETRHSLGLPVSAFGKYADKGAVTLLLTDLPIQNRNVTSVMVNFRSIEVNSAAKGWMTVLDFGDTGKVFDLLQLQNGVTAALGSFSLAPGTYDQMRFILNDANYVIVKNGNTETQEPLKIPSGSQTGIKLIHSFTVDALGYTVLTVDFNAQKSIQYNKGQGFMLKPVISVIGAQTSTGASSTVSATRGGSAGILGEVMLDIPAGALNADTAVEILPLKGAPFNPPLSNRQLLSNRYELLPDGTQFNSDITITMNYDPAEIAAKGLNENDIDIVYYDVNKQDWVSIGGTVNLATKTVTAKVNHFTAFGMTSAQGNAPMIAPAEIRYTGYNPATGTAVTQVPEKVVATVTPKVGTITSVNLHLFKIGQAPNPSVIPMVENPVGSGQYEVTLSPALFYPEVGPLFDIQVYIEATDSAGGFSTAPKGALLADPLTWHLYQYNADADGDLMNDRWEFDNGLNPDPLDPLSADGGGDPDGDGITNLAEYQGGTNPNGFDATVGGSVTGLAAGETLVLDNNGEVLTISGGGTGTDAFIFLNRVRDTAAYNIFVVTAPAAKTCTVTGGTGNVIGAHVTVTVDCVITRPKILPGVFLDTEQQYNTQSIAMGDVDGDGDLDMVEGNYNQSLIIYLNDGAGRYTKTGQTFGNFKTKSIALGDVDNDGDLDVIEGNYTQPNRLYRNDGTGRFTDSWQNIGGFFPTNSIVLGDVDNDGDLDIAEGVTNQPDKIYRNNGAGFFTDSGQNLGASPTLAVVLIDVDNDGDLDMAQGNSSQPNKIYLNNGSGVFADSGQALGGTNSTAALAAGDIDGDGDLDIVEGNASHATRIYLNNGFGQFADSGQELGITYWYERVGWTNWVLRSRSNNTRSVALADMDGDGDLDIIEGNNGLDAIFENRGTGFSTGGSNTHTANSASLVTGDVDNDGDLDVISGRYDYSNQVSLNNGAYSFTLITDLLGNNITTSVALADVDNDGDLDLLEGTTQGSHIYLNGGTGNYTNSGQNLGTIYAHSVKAGDIDGDGDLDIVVGNLQQPNRIYLNDGAGIFTDSGQLLGADSTYSVALDDLDNDGDLDLVEGNFGAANKVYLNDGTGIFTDSGQLLGSNRTFNIALGDFDGDGDLDLLEAITDMGNKLYMNDGTGIFTDSGKSLGTGNTVSLATGDVDGDGDLDFVAGRNSFLPNKVYFNDGAGNFTESLQNLGSDPTVSIAMGDIDNDGDLDIVAGDSYYNGTSDKVYINNGSGVFTDSGQRIGDSYTYTITLGDIDGDGDLDLVEGTNFPQTINIFPNLTW